MKKGKLLFLLHLPPPIHGAAMIGDYIKNSERINKEFECTFLSISTSTSLNESFRKNLAKYTLIFKIYGQIFRILLKNNYDLCYLTINAKGQAFFKEIVIVFICRLFNCNLVYHYHNKGIAKVHHNFFYNLLYKYQFKDSRALMLSPLLYFDVSKYLPQHRVSYCANGIPTEETINLKKLNLRRSSNKTVELLFLSNIMKAKGVYVLLDACKILKEKNINFRMTFVGAPMDIDETDFTEYIISNTLGKLVSYEGKKYGKEKQEYFSRADIFIHPTLDDAFPLVVLEAMQYGLPVVTTDEGSLSEIVENGINGYIVEKEQPVALANKIAHLIEFPILRQDIGTANRKKFEEFYTLKKMERNLVDIFHNILEENKPADIREMAKAFS